MGHTHDSVEKSQKKEHLSGTTGFTRKDGAKRGHAPTTKIIYKDYTKR